jgi:hypothetical protein
MMDTEHFSIEANPTFASAMKSLPYSTSTLAPINTIICANGYGELHVPKVAASRLDNLDYRLFQPGAPALRAFARL